MVGWLTPRAAAWLLAPYAVVVVALVFEPYPHAADDSVDLGHRLLAAIGLGGVVSPGLVEFGLNVLLFVPMSLLGSVAIRRVTRLQWVGIGLLASLTIEFGQLLSFPDRSASLRDVTANTFGALLGALLSVRLWGRAAESLARQDGLEEQQDPNG